MKKRANQFASSFADLWLVGVSVFPWLMFAMNIVFFNVNLGFWMFNFILSTFVSIGLIGLAYVFFIRRKKYTLSPEKNFVLRNNKKVFFGGILMSYLSGVILMLFKPVMGILILMGNTLLLPFLLIFYYIGKKAYDKLKTSLSSTQTI